MNRNKTNIPIPELFLSLYNVPKKNHRIYTNFDEITYAYFVPIQMLSAEILIRVRIILFVSGLQYYNSTANRTAMTGRLIIDLSLNESEINRSCCIIKFLSYGDCS